MRVKTSFTRTRAHKKVLARTKGFRMTKNRLTKVAREADIHAGQYAFKGRKLRRRDMRALWIVRINAALQPLEISYSKFFGLMKKADIQIDRKILSDLANSDPATFQKIVSEAKTTA